MVNGITAGINAASVANKDVFKSQNDNNEIKQKEQVELAQANLSKVENLKEQIKNGEYKLDLQKSAEKMALDLLNL